MTIAKLLETIERIKELQAIDERDKTSNEQWELSYLLNLELKEVEYEEY